MKNIGYYVGLLLGVWLLLTALRRSNSNDWRYRAPFFFINGHAISGAVSLADFKTGETEEC